MTAAADTAVRLDVSGLTDVGRKRKTNEDHFVVAALQKSVSVRQTSLPDAPCRSARRSASTGHGAADCRASDG